MNQPGINTHRPSLRKRPAWFRPLLSSSLLLILLAHPQAWHSWTLLFHLKIKSEVRRIQAGEEPEQVRAVWVKIPANWLEKGHPDLVWTEGDEFRYRGEMYDILNQEQRGDTIWYHCHHDKAETALVNGLLEKLQAPDETATGDDWLCLLESFFEKWQLCKAIVFLSGETRHGKVLHAHSGIADGRNSEAPCPPPPWSFPFV